MTTYLRVRVLPDDGRAPFISSDLVVKRTPLVMDKRTALLVEPGQTFEETSG